MNRIFKTKTAKYATIVSLVLIGSVSIYLSVKANPVYFSANIPNPTCLDNYESWTHSQQYNPNNNWNLDFLPFETNFSADSQHNPDRRREQFIDLNSDGLVDYFYAFHGHWDQVPNQQSGRRENLECVYLNNGNGWDRVYRCVAKVDVPYNGGEVTQNYWGDCAAQ